MIWLYLFEVLIVALISILWCIAIDNMASNVTDKIDKDDCGFP